LATEYLNCSATPLQSKIAFKNLKFHNWTQIFVECPKKPPHYYWSKKVLSPWKKRKVYSIDLECYTWLLLFVICFMILDHKVAGKLHWLASS
jgi:hypothetical protein